MPKNGSIHARVDEQVKARAEKILRRVGISTTDAVTLLLHQIILNNGLPFDVRIPNAESRRALAELAAGGGKVFTGPTSELFDSIVGLRKQQKA